MSLKFEDLTEDQVLYFWNGVGSDHFTFNPPDFIFKEISKRHDFDYWVGGNDEDRKNADQRYKEDGRLLISLQPSKIRWFYHIIHELYCFFLFKLGKEAFEYGPKSQTWEELKKKIDSVKADMRKQYKRKRRIAILSAFTLFPVIWALGCYLFNSLFI